MKNIALIIAFRDFRDEEYFHTKKVLESRGLKTKTFSNEKGVALGRFGGEAEANALIDDLDVDEFDAVVFIGGPGAPKFLDNEASYKISREALDKGKVLAGICIAPTILAKADALKGRKCTVWSSDMDKSAIKILKEKGGIYREESVVVDGNLVTADNYEAARPFAEKIADILTKKEI
ncbi:MAG: DJ-1/PfpI family protein [Candidatus Pacebacteria bacterium]|nr:DJ-1/PfpI family protein [Candidatus Paceibacterota bacterium]